MTGPLTGTMIPGAGRGVLCARSPTPFPKYAWTYSGFGGGWPSELKYAGYDGIVVEGKSDVPVFVNILDNEKEIIDASHLWGLDTYETQKKIAKELGDPEIKSMTIGPAGENLVHESIVLNETSSVAGYAGMGAVMGSKKLKAISIRGKGKINVANPDKLILLLNELRKCFGFEGIWEYDNEPFAREKNKPVDRYNRQIIPNVDKKYYKYLDEAGPSAASKGHLLHNSACTGCYLSCKGYFSFEGLPPGTAHCGQWWFSSIKSPKDSGLSAGDEDSWLANSLANTLGLNAFEVAILTRLLKDCFDAGLLTEKDIILPEALGGNRKNSDFIKSLYYNLAYRKGLESNFSDGLANGARSLGPKFFEFYRKYTTSRGIKSHHATLLAYIIWAMDSRDPYDSVHDDNSTNHRPENSKYYLGFDGSNPWSYETVPKTAIILQHSKELKNSLLLCDWCYPLISYNFEEKKYCGKDFPALLFSAVTGIPVDTEGLMKYAERITNILRAIMITEGRTKQEDDIDEVRYEEELKINPRDHNSRTIKLDRNKFEEAKKSYYELRGWSPITGYPSVTKLDEIGLKDVREKLQQLGANIS
jgi:aldehyde:ferredoxin oxidoreductase